MDLKLLEADIQKWLPWLSVAAQVEWRDFFENLVPELGAIDPQASWLLEDLKASAESRRSETVPLQVSETDIFASERAIESHVRIIILYLLFYSLAWPARFLPFPVSPSLPRRNGNGRKRAGHARLPFLQSVTKGLHATTYLSSSSAKRSLM